MGRAVPSFQKNGGELYLPALRSSATHLCKVAEHLNISLKLRFEPFNDRFASIEQKSISQILKGVAKRTR